MSKKIATMNHYSVTYLDKTRGEYSTVSLYAAKTSEKQLRAYFTDILNERAEQDTIEHEKELGKKVFYRLLDIELLDKDCKVSIEYPDQFFADIANEREPDASKVRLA